MIRRIMHRWEKYMIFQIPHSLFHFVISIIHIIDICGKSILSEALTRSHSNKNYNGTR